MLLAASPLLWLRSFCRSALLPGARQRRRVLDSRFFSRAPGRETASSVPASSCPRFNARGLLFVPASRPGFETPPLPSAISLFFVSRSHLRTAFPCFPCHRSHPGQCLGRSFPLRGSAVTRRKLCTTRAGWPPHPPVSPSCPPGARGPTNV